MVTVTAELSGGLGNQMFQRAYTLALAKRLGAVATVDADHINDCQGTTRDFSLGPFGVSPAPSDPDCARYLAIDTDGYMELDVGEGERMAVRGLWMGEGPWSDAAADVRAEFSFGGGPIEAIAVHVRRTDFLSPLSPMAALDVDYYRRALALLPRAPALVFSDDLTWCRENLPDLTLIDAPDQYQAMALMSRCRHHVIANSSFSWWAAWLGEKGAVVAPSRWLKRTAAVTKQIVPERWMTA